MARKLCLMSTENERGQIHQVSQAIGNLQAKVDGIATEVLRYHQSAEKRREEMHDEVTGLREEIVGVRKEIADLVSLKDQGKGWLGALTLVAGLIGSALTYFFAQFFGK